MNDALQKAKIRQAEAKIKTCKIARDAAYEALTKAQSAGAGPDRRQRLADAYDRAEEKLEAAENAAREMKRKAMGLTPTVGGGSLWQRIRSSGRLKVYPSDPEYQDALKLIGAGAVREVTSPALAPWVEIEAI